MSAVEQCTEIQNVSHTGMLYCYLSWKRNNCNFSCKEEPKDSVRCRSATWTRGVKSLMGRL